MIRSILIANRGEIACRVIATAQRRGLRTVAVYSDADADALHVQMADTAVRIGPPPVSESYLNTDAILAAAMTTGADAIHPGYGFLSENPDFVDAVEKAGLIFIGPPASAIRAMGLKDAAKRCMAEVGVPIVPGYHGADQSPKRLADEAEAVGYPVLIKARAGGGGKGMRLVKQPSEFSQALAGAVREAEASFGDGAVLIEKFVSSPRHIEVQIFGDAHGNVVHLFERDCSLQRRHQKVIEEAPAPGMTPEMRLAMGNAAVEAARAIGYRGAGTVEFIVDGSGPLSPDKFWFMEMNTRLQVEHPVTEAITGLDLVALQIEVAQGAPLPFSQDDLSIDGHSIEARVYAENPKAGFLPSTGRLEQLKFPTAKAFETGAMRVDAGVREGDVISPSYDPMIAKLITYGPDRATALARVAQALANTHCAGLETNLGFLARLVEHPDFVSGTPDTGLIARDMDALITLDKAAFQTALAVAAITVLTGSHPDDPQDPWDMIGWRSFGTATQTVRFLHRGAEHVVPVHIHNPTKYTVGDQTLGVKRAADRITLTINGVMSTASTCVKDRDITVHMDRATFRFHLPDPFDRQSNENASTVITAPMPGRVIEVAVESGAHVVEGAPLLVLEAMKMEHVMRAPRDAIVAELLVSLDDQVDAGHVLVRFEENDDD